MAKFTVYAHTNMVGSKVTDELEIDDSELEGLSESEREDLINSYAQDAMWNLIEWGWNEEQ